MSRNIKNVTALKPISGYTLVSDEYLSDVDSVGLVFRHDKSGARVCVVSNDDENKVFSIAFRTPPIDDTGVAHIIEHTVLCGSEKYPSRDPFMQLAKGSLNTFLNAMTYPDKTIYPVASCNDHDFENLMAVYMDAVFKPNIYKYKEIFMQEGWHYELDSPNDELKINGIVYSEMKGVLSSPDSLLYDEISKALFPDSVYGRSSGGDPDMIPFLRYDDYLAFHTKHYHPSNSYIVLWGDMDIEERLEWMDKNYLSEYEKIDVSNTVVHSQSRLDGLRSKSAEYHISMDEEISDKTYLAYVCEVASSLDPIECLAWDVISEVLLNTPGAPIKQSLVDAGIGQDVSGDFLDHMLTTAFAIVSKNTEACKKEQFISLIREELKRAADGIDRDSVEAALNNREFLHREADFGGMPKGLYYSIDMLQSWLYDDNAVFDYVRWDSVYDILRKRLKDGYFENLIKEKLLSPKNAVVLTLSPRRGLNDEKNAAVKNRLVEYKSCLTDKELNNVVDEYRRLKEYQSAPLRREEIDCIPSLNRCDIKRDVREFSNIETSIGKCSAIYHALEVKGLAYIRFIFDINDVSPKWLPYFGLLSSLLGVMSTERHNYNELSKEIKWNIGRLDFGAADYVRYGSIDDTKLYFSVGISCLSDKVEHALSLMQEIITETRFDDIKRLKELFLEIRSESQSRIISRGNSVASGRVLSYFTKSGMINELLGGLDCYKFVCDAIEHFDERAYKIACCLKKACRYIFSPERMIISVATDECGMNMLSGSVNGLCEKLSSFSIPTLPNEYENFNGIFSNMETLIPYKANEGFMTSSQVQYLVRGGNIFIAGYKYSGVIRVLARILSYDYLYNNIRVKGGAYGCGCVVSPDNGNVIFYSYRDPNLAETDNVYRNSPEWINDLQLDEDELTRNVIGCFNSIDYPLSPRILIARSINAYLTGVTADDLLREREEILSVTLEQIKSAAAIFKSVIDQGYICAVGSEDRLKKDSILFDNLELLT